MKGEQYVYCQIIVCSSLHCLSVWCVKDYFRLTEETLVFSHQTDSSIEINRKYRK